MPGLIIQRKVFDILYRIWIKVTELDKNSCWKTAASFREFDDFCWGYEELQDLR